MFCDFSTPPSFSLLAGGEVVGAWVIKPKKHNGQTTG